MLTRASVTLPCGVSPSAGGAKCQDCSDKLFTLDNQSGQYVALIEHLFDRWSHLDRHWTSSRSLIILITISMRIWGPDEYRDSTQAANHSCGMSPVQRLLIDRHNAAQYLSMSPFRRPDDIVEMK